jgi:hypothetical protein
MEGDKMVFVDCLRDGKLIKTYEFLWSASAAATGWLLAVVRVALLGREGDPPPTR